MPGDVQELHDLTCSDFKASGICIPDFTDIDDFKEIGAGAFACVYRAKWSGRGVIAVKKLATQVGAPMTLKTIRDFRTEAALQRTLNHPNIVSLIGVCCSPLSLIMEFVPRGNLFALLGDGSVSLDWHQRLKIALGTVKGMAYLHAQDPIIIHRDLKSLNLLLTNDLDCKVTDFGLSRFKAETDERMTGQCGTYHWMAPEVINSEIYTEKADVYSVAIILWEIYTRAIPYDGMKPLQAAMHVIQGGRLTLPEGVPSWFKHLVTSCWDANPDSRPSMKYVCDILSKAFAAVSQKMTKT
jgi:serine/threonine protein kinase